MPMRVSLMRAQAFASPDDQPRILQPRARGAASHSHNAMRRGCAGRAAAARYAATAGSARSRPRALELAPDRLPRASPSPPASPRARALPRRVAATHDELEPAPVDAQLDCGPAAARARLAVERQARPARPSSRDRCRRGSARRATRRAARAWSCRRCSASRARRGCCAGPGCSRRASASVSSTPQQSRISCGMPGSRFSS